MTRGRAWHTATLLQDGRVLIAGGEEAVTAELYDPSTRRFSATASLREPRWLHTATLLQDGKVLIAGGGPLVAELYDPATGTFSDTGAMSSLQVGHTATLLPDGKVLIAGGRSSIPPEVITAPAEIYDPATGAFSRTGSYASPGTMYRSGGPLWPKANLLLDGRVLITGDNPAEVYDPQAGAFSHSGRFASEEFRHGIYWHQATSLSDGRVLVTGGNDDWTCGGFDRAELYDPATGRFRDVGTMTVSRDIHTATLLPDGKVLIAGGGSGWCGFAELSSLELFDPATESFAPAGTMTVTRSGHTATLLNDGSVLIAGGQSSYAIHGLRTAELYRAPEPAARTRGARR